MERRRTKRKLLLYYGRVYDEKGQKQLGYLVDVTETGFMLLSDEPLPTGQARRLRVEVTSDLNQERPFLNLVAKSIWCEADIAPGKYNVGFEILGLRPEDAEVIRNIVQTYGFRDN
jgi:PilZ domain-containing protein